MSFQRFTVYVFVLNSVYYIVFATNINLQKDILPRFYHRRQPQYFILFHFV